MTITHIARSIGYDDVNRDLSVENGGTAVVAETAAQKRPCSLLGVRQGDHLPPRVDKMHSLRPRSVFRHEHSTTTAVLRETDRCTITEDNS